MDDIEKLYRSRQTLLEMMRDRGYEFSDGLFVNNKEDFKKLFYSKQLDFIIESPGKTPVFIKWILNFKIKPNMIKEIIDIIREENFQESNPGKIILITKAKPNTNISKIFKDKEFRGTELFWLNTMIFNITKHVLVPQHTKLNEDEIKKLMTDMYISNKFNLPIMLKSDPITRYLDLSSGDVCRITRYSPMSGHYFSYRVVR
jgi:DNA-directed RNA polymerases I, II, and III subunit RPABC1